MNEQRGQIAYTIELPTHQVNADAKVQHIKDIYKCCEFFHYTIGTTLDCAKTTGILRNSITWYVRDLMKLGILKVVCIQLDATTGRRAKHYSSNPNKWKEVLL